ncbi:MAG: flavin reductase [Bacteroidetes bacterium GWF2_38_335]|nr:MAG: flavin reductase [Bacteroidetes bacterium GWF2_38_335]OFY80703.1 MAG: flavin reductase [Bacteroidetes bacterium RIFOXYA12_FULL_38_20]HBS87051.1 flavin reductase [Bacteroidales bacterium]
MRDFKEIKPVDINESAVKLIGSDWMLITSGDIENFNMMTAAWGGMGFLWKKPVVFIYVRPTRHTYGFLEKNDYFTISFFDEIYRSALNLCGTKSGRDINKKLESGLIPMTSEHSVFFEEARLQMECRKIYADMVKPELFLDKSIDRNYPLKDYHKMYIGEIVHCIKS